MKSNKAIIIKNIHKSRFSLLLRLTFFQLCILICTQQLLAQTERTIYTSIGYIDTARNPSIAYCYSAYAPLMAQLQKAQLITKSNKAAGEDFDEKLGAATVLSFSDSVVAFAIIPNARGKERGIKLGDLIAIDVMDTVFNPAHLVAHVLPLQLKILDQHEDPFFNEPGLTRRYRADANASDEWLLDVLYNDLKKFYINRSELLQGTTFTKPFEKGRYAGKNVQQVFKELTRDDVESFLWYMISFPGKYIGVEYKFNETFATWLINDAPYGGFEVLRQYRAAKGDSALFIKKLKAMPGLLESEGISNNTATAANNVLYYSDQLADEMYRAAVLYSYASGDMEGAGLAYLFKAEKLHNAGLYDSSLVFCKLSEKIFTQNNNYDRRLDLLFKQCYIYYTTSRYENSMAMLKKILPLIKEAGDKLVDYTTKGATRKYFEYSTYTYYKSGRYAEALRYIDTSLLASGTDDDAKTLSNTAYLYNLQGKIFKSQELYDKSLQAFQKSVENYRRVGDLKNASIVSNEIGIVYFRQGKYHESNDLLLGNIKTFELSGDLDNAGYGYSQIGQNYWNLGLYDSAIASHNIAISYRQKAGNRSGQAFSWKQLGTLYQKAGLKPLALAALDTAAKLYYNVGEMAELADVYLEAGQVYKNDKETDKAQDNYRQAANVLAKAGNKAGYANALFEMGLLAFEKQPTVAELYMDSCRVMSKEAGLNAQVAYSMMNKASLIKNRGDIKTGNQWLYQAKQIIDSIAEPHSFAQFQKMLGYDAEWALELDSANRCFDRARVIFDSTDMALALQMMMRQAYNLQSMGRYKQAENIITEVLKRAADGNYTLELGNAYQNKAWMLLQQGKINDGLALADSASKYYKLSGNSYSLASINSLRGDFYRKMYRFNDAFDYYHRSDSIYLAESNPWARSNGMMNFIVLYYFQGDYQTSLDYTRRALAARPFLLEDQTYLDLQACIIENFYYLGKTDSALLMLKKYLPIAQQKKLTGNEAWLALMQGRILVDKQQYKEAIPWLQKANTPHTASNDLSIYQQALAYLGIAWQGAGQPDSSARAFTEACHIARIFQLPSFSWEALYLAGLDAYNHNDLPKAIDILKESVALLNKQANNLYGGEEAGKLFRKHPKKADLYFKLMSALSKAGRKEEAWQYANLSQAAALSDLAGGLAADMQNPEKQAALLEAQTRFQQLQSVGNALQESKKDSLAKAGQITVLEKTKAIAEEEYLNYIGQLKKDFPELGTFFANQVNPENFRNLHSYLPEEMAMLMYVVNDEELLIFWATTEKTGIQIQAIPKDFYKLTDAWIYALKNPNRPANAGPLVLRTKLGKVPVKAKPDMDVKEGAQQLYDLLIKPVIAEIGSKTEWCIIPNGKLTHVPFHVLGTTNSSGAFEYLAASKSIFYTNKPNEMFMPWSRRNKNNFAAFGNPDKSLASAGEEVKQIAKTLHASNVYLEDSATATKAANSLSNMHYVHFATHGVLSYPDFDSSYLVFAPGPGHGDGDKLTLYDIRRLNIKGCDLVTLSACETAVSAEVSKGWYVSPANAFLINKVRSVVASLWEVDDKSTSMLMQRFYQHLQDQPKAEALRQAMADVSAVPEFEHPFYWAAFVLYGDWK